MTTEQNGAIHIRTGREPPDSPASTRVRQALAS
jgi:hypothetical protein